MVVRVRGRFFSLLLVATILLGGALGGVSAVVAQDGEPVELLVWDQFTDPDQNDAAEAIYAAFTEQNPNITIRREAVTSDQMRQTVRTALASGTGPDIIFYDAGPGFAGVLADANLLVPLGDYATEYGWDDRIAASALQGTTINDELFGLPLQIDLIGMWVNNTLIEQEGLTVPRTFEELTAFCTQAAELGYIPIAFSNSPGWQAGHQFSMAANDMIGPEAMGQLLFEQEGSWDTPEMTAAIQSFFVDAREAGCYGPEVNGLTYDDGNSLFYTGESLLNTTGSWIVNEIEANMADFDVEFVPFPQPEGAEGQYWVTGVGSAYFISANSEYPDEAAQFLDYLFSSETAVRWVNEARFPVPVEFDPAAVEASPQFEAVITTLTTAIAEDTAMGYNIDVLAPARFNEMMTNGFQAIIAGDKTAEQQAADLQAAWEQGLAGE